jgi:hypothetical protein
MISSLGNVVTEFVGALPIIAAYLKRMQFIEKIDALVTPLRGNHRRLSHGETSFILILYLLCRPHVMYKVEDWVCETTYLRVLFPDIEPGHFSDGDCKLSSEENPLTISKGKGYFLSPLSMYSRSGNL